MPGYPGKVVGERVMKNFNCYGLRLFARRVIFMDAPIPRRDTHGEVKGHASVIRKAESQGLHEILRRYACVSGADPIGI